MVTGDNMIVRPAPCRRKAVDNQILVGMAGTGAAGRGIALWLKKPELQVLLATIPKGLPVCIGIEITQSRCRVS
jgi:hypothetical protein